MTPASASSSNNSDPAGSSSNHGGPPARQLPPGTNTLGMFLFLIALAVLFIGSMAAYVLIRITGPHAPDFGAIHVPKLLWFSTVIILISSVTMQHAAVSVQRERQTAFKKSMVITLFLALFFVAIQTPAMVTLLRMHEAMRQEQMMMYGMVFMLVLLHALHVLGGLFPLAVYTFKAVQGRYDHEHWGPIRYVAMYWHFLDGVWLTMFVVFLTLS